MQPGSLLRLIVLALFWGSSFLWIKIGLRGLTPAQITLTRLALGAAVLLAITLAWRQRIPRGRGLWVHLAIAAFFANALPYTLFGIGEQHIDSALAGVLNATTPLWTLAVALLARHGERMTPTRTTGLFLGFAGTLLIFAPWQHANDVDPWGALAVLTASASYGISFIYMDRYLVGRGIPTIALSASQLLAATGWLALAVPANWRTPQLDGEILAAMGVLGILGTGLAYLLNYRLLADEGPTVTSTVTYLLPIVAVILGAIVLDEAITARVIVGMAIVLAGVALTRRRPAQPKSAAACRVPADT